MGLQILSFLLALLSGIAGAFMFRVEDIKLSPRTTKRVISFLKLFVVVAFMAALICGYFAVFGKDYGVIRSLSTTILCAVITVANGVLFMYPKTVFKLINNASYKVFWELDNRLAKLFAKILAWGIIIIFIFVMINSLINGLWMLSIIIAYISTFMFGFVMAVVMVLLYIILRIIYKLFILIIKH